MSVNLSPLAGAGWQFFTNNGVPLAGGKLETYLAGTTTPAATYTSSSGGTANTNPIVLDSAGRTASEVWLTQGTSYKFILKDASDVLIGTYDNISGINDFVDLSNNTNIALGDALVGFKQANSSGLLSGAVAKTVHQKLTDAVSVFDFLTTAQIADVQTNGGAVDVTSAVQNALNNAGNIYFPAGTYVISSTLNVLSNTCLDFGAATISYNCGSTPLFTVNTKEFVTFRGGRFYGGTASAWLDCYGSSETGGTYSRQIRIEGVWLETDKTVWACKFSNSSRQIMISDCFFSMNNGIKITNKVVEFHMTNSMVFRNGGSATTYGFNIGSTNASAYPEGIYLTNIEVDFFEVGWRVTDVFVLEMNTCWGGGTDLALDFAQRVTTSCRDITINGCVFNQGSTFGPYSAGTDLRINFSGCIFETATVEPLYFKSNAYQAKINGCTFSSANGAANALVCANNTGAITFSNNFIDATFTNVVNIIGTSTLYPNYITDNHFLGSLFYAGVARPTFLSGNDVTNDTDASYVMPNYHITPTNYAATATLGQITMNVAKGQTGVIQCGLNISSLTLGGGAFLFMNVPTGIQFPDGSGWSALSIYATLGYMSINIPFYASQDVVAGSFYLVNQDCTNISVGQSSWISIVLK
jgi:hypothetical protein